MSKFKTLVAIGIAIAVTALLMSIPYNRELRHSKGWHRECQNANALLESAVPLIPKDPRCVYKNDEVKDNIKAYLKRHRGDK